MDISRRFQNLYRGLKAFSRLCLARARNEYIPWYMFMLITERCNLRCKYCFVDVPSRYEEDTKKIKEWSTEEALRIIDDFYAIGARYLNFLGGEPLLRDDLEQLIDYANKKGMLTDIYTNGVLIDKKINALKKLSRITISLEGDEATHDTDRGIGTYKKIIENMKLLNKNNMRFTINYTVTRNNANIDSLKHILELAKKYNALVGVGEACIKFDPKLADILVAKDNLREFWKGVKRFKLQGYPIQKTLKSIDHCIDTIDFISGEDIYNEGDYLPYNKRFYPCAMGRYWAYLDSDGTLYPCANLFHKLGKNVFTLGVKEAWKSLNQEVKCYACRDSITGGVSCFLGLDFNTLKEAAKHFLNVYIIPLKQSR